MLDCRYNKQRTLSTSKPSIANLKIRNITTLMRNAMLLVVTDAYKWWITCLAYKQLEIIRYEKTVLTKDIILFLFDFLEDYKKAAKRCSNQIRIRASN